MYRILMCEPKFYGIQYEINPWMSRLRPADSARAADQWADLYRVLTKEVGCEVVLLEPVEGLPDLVFTANAGLVHGDLFVRSNFRHLERAREEPYFQAQFEAMGFRVATLPKRQRFEGEGDAFVCDGRLFAGYRFRSDYASHKALGRLLNIPVISLELVDPWFYHLDTCFCPLRLGMLLYYPQAFSLETQRLIEMHFPRRLAVNEEEARRFVCNSVPISDRVVMNTGCPQAQQMLEEAGYQVHEADTSEFIKAGGSIKCLILFVEKDSEPDDQSKSTQPQMVTRD